MNASLPLSSLFTLFKVPAMQSEKTKLFISKAAAKHVDRYDYSLVEYKLSKFKVKIICREHGVFEQKANNHLSGKGCPECGLSKIGEKSKVRSSANFKGRAREVHGNTYCYDAVDYAGSRAKIIITCCKHGKFEQVADSHLSGSGCPSCARDGLFKLKVKRAAASFKWKASVVHDDRYGYQDVEYKGAINKVVITCSLHGNFACTPNNHLRGRGCPLCPRRYDQPTQVYIMLTKGMVKIGISVAPDERLRQHQRRGQPFTSSLVHTYELPNFVEAYKVEQLAHDMLSHVNAKLSGFDGCSEWFNTCTEDAKKTIEQAIKINSGATNSEENNPGQEAAELGGESEESNTGGLTA